MGTINGYIKAICKKCGKQFDWYSFSNLPFIDSEIIGTCDSCFEKESKRANPSHR